MSKYDEVVHALRAEGLTEEEIVGLTANISREATQRLHAMIVAALDEEDFKALDQIKEHSEADKEIQRRFQEKTGQDPDVLMREFMDKFAEGFLKEYQEKKNEGK